MTRQQTPQYPALLNTTTIMQGGDKVKPSRRPSRKYRRRPGNLLQEYNRRSQKNVWLETHIWHAKRFHMKRQWGYALPDTATCRGHRASLRAATTGCLLQVCCALRVSVVSSDYTQSLPSGKCYLNSKWLPHVRHGWAETFLRWGLWAFVHGGPSEWAALNHCVTKYSEWWPTH